MKKLLAQGAIHERHRSNPKHTGRQTLRVLVRSRVLRQQTSLHPTHRRLSEQY